ncbi:MAG: hypothetical protein CMA94_03885 [Euryarchaeota archaeon]|nr:hypothetical protein [Euryarchaeota archaeon]
MNVLIVGAGLVAYGCAYAALQDGYKVQVADHPIEFGLPNTWPSVLLERNSIPLSFSTDQNFEGSDNSFRHEWIMKGMSIELARLGAEYLHRTRIVSSVQDNNGVFSVELTGAGQQNGMFEYDKVIDTTQDTWIPWAKPHNISEASNTYHAEREKAIGYVHLQSSTGDFNDAIYQIHREDGLLESWYQGDHTTTNLKVIEIISTMLPVNHALWDCSVRFQTGMKLWSDRK